jgi:hypothetical protein
METEVIAQFASLLSQGYLNGYEMISLPGSETRYDGLFNVKCETPAEDAAGAMAVAGISSDMFVNGKFQRTNQWLEFKLNLADLIDEFGLTDGLPNKKYYQQVNLVVRWSTAGVTGRLRPVHLRLGLTCADFLALPNLGAHSAGSRTALLKICSDVTTPAWPMGRAELARAIRYERPRPIASPT